MSHTKTINGKYGPVTFFNKDMYVGRSLYYYGEYGPDETDRILELAAETKGLCLDVGANIGCISQALIVNGFRTVAFEPQPEVFSLLVENTPGIVEAKNVALGHVKGVAKMPKVHYSEKGNFGGLGIGTHSNLGYYDVPLITLDSLNIQEQVTFIKLDVEGFEQPALMGAKATIDKFKPILYVEDDRVEKSASLRKYISEELNYSIEEHQPLLYRGNNYFNHAVNVWDRLYASHNLICRPK